MHRDEGRYAQAEPYSRRRLELLEKQLGPEDLALADAVDDLGWLYYGWERYREAEPLFRRSLGLYERRLASDHPHEDDARRLTRTLRELELLCVRSERYEEAAAVFEDAAEVLVRVFGPKHSSVGRAFEDYAGLLYFHGRHDEGQAVENRRVELWNRPTPTLPASR